MYKVKVAVCSQICAKYINAIEHYEELLNVEPGGT
jgi:hypothetical protein